MTDMLADAALDQLFYSARTHNAWAAGAVDDETLHRLYDLLKWGPTSANCSPARYRFLKSEAAKARLKLFLSPGNQAKTAAAPVTVIIGYDLGFAENLPMLFPHDQSAKQWFANPQVAETTAFRNGSLQGAYLIVAARALGLDCGPMSGFDNAGVDREFFAGTTIKSNFLCNLGHGDPKGLFARSPRFDFEAVCRIE